MTENVTDTNFRTTSSPIQTPALLSMVMTLTIGGTGTIIALFLLITTSKKHKWSNFYRLVLGFILSDVIGLLGILPIFTCVFLNRTILAIGQPLCDFVAFIFTFSGLMSTMLIAAMSLDRFLAVWYPFIYNSPRNRRYMNFILVALVGLCSILTSMPLLGVNNNVLYSEEYICFFNIFTTEIKGILFSFLYAIIVIGMVIVMLVSNILVMIVLIRRNKKINRSSLISESKWNDICNTVFLIILMLAFSSCWIPLAVRIINQSSLPDPGYSGDMLAVRIIFSHLVIDPWTYIVLRKDTVSSLLNVGRQCIIACKSPPTQSTDGNRHNERSSGETDFLSFHSNSAVR